MTLALVLRDALREPAPLGRHSAAIKDWLIGMRPPGDPHQQPRAQQRHEPGGSP
jgi:hypothetical protein